MAVEASVAVVELIVREKKPSLLLSNETTKDYLRRLGVESFFFT